MQKSAFQFWRKSRNQDLQSVHWGGNANAGKNDFIWKVMHETTILSNLLQGLRFWNSVFLQNPSQSYHEWNKNYDLKIWKVFVNSMLSDLDAFIDHKTCIEKVISTFSFD